MASLNARAPSLFLHIALTFLWLSTLSIATPTGVSLDIGPNQLISNTKSVFNSGPITPANTNNMSLDVFQTAREGELFEVTLSLSPGTYDLYLGFVETQSCSDAARVFHIFVNGEIMRESFDIYEVAKGCGRAYITSIPNLSISHLHVKPVVVKFVSVSGLATLSYIQATASKKQCIPVTKSARINEPHLAHSVPGVYNPVVDHDSDKYEFVRLDGRESHTHFSFIGGSGRIISYEWSIVETGKIISTNATFTYKFPLGTTRVRLTVTDNVCSQHRDDTSITVTTSSLKGQYCYYYPFNDHTKTLGPQTLLNSPPACFIQRIIFSEN